MLNQKEEDFIKYWETARNRQKKLFYQLAVGLPVGLLGGLLILANFYSGWFKRADMMARGGGTTDLSVILIIAVAGIAIFFAIFSKKFQWERLEQRYRELLAKKQKDATDAAETTSQTS